jgi:hypothetical protein
MDAQLHSMKFGRLLLAVALGFLASSAYQFFWSRLAWEHTHPWCADKCEGSHGDGSVAHTGADSS